MPQFNEIVTEPQEVREILGQPAQRVLDKVITELDQHCRDIIARSPFLLIASANRAGQMDVSPKGDPPGFVHVLDDKTIAIPDRVGNRRADTLVNLVENPSVGLIFLVPGKQETLRINGTAQVVRDAWLRQQLSMQGKTPDLAIVVSVQEAFLHCAKCIIRSNLWDQDTWQDTTGMASLAQIMADHTRTTDSVSSLEAAVAESYRDRLY